MQAPLDEKARVLVRPIHLALAVAVLLVGGLGSVITGTTVVVRTIDGLGNKISALTGRVTQVENEMERTSAFMAQASRANSLRAGREAQRKEMCADSRLKLPEWACFGLLSDDELEALRGVR